MLISDKPSTESIQYYILVIGGLIVALLSCMVLLQVYNKCRKCKTNEISGQIEPDVQPPLPSNENENIYHEIEEVSTPESRRNDRDSYLIVENDQSSTMSDIGGSNISLRSEGYLNPYQPTIPECEQPLHKYDDCHALGVSPNKTDLLEKDENECERSMNSECCDDKRSFREQSDIIIVENHA